MNISEKINELEINIKSFIAENNLPVLIPNNNYRISLDGENQCVFAQSGNSHLYLIAHEDVQIMEDFLNLSPNTVNKINKIRAFIRDMYDDTNNFKHKRLKVKIDPDQSVEFSIIGLGLGGLRIELKATELVVSWIYGDNVSVIYSLDDDIEQKVNEALDLVIPTILTKLGFLKCSEHSEEVIDFMNKSTDDLIVEHFSKFGFDYIHQNELIANACSSTKISLDDLNNYNKKNEKPNLIKIPHMMMSILPKIMSNISSDISVHSKFKQLLSLIYFYDYLKPTNSEALLIFKEYSKFDLAPSASFQSGYFTLLMGGLLRLDVGHQLKPDPDDEEHLFDSPSENGYAYMFEIYLYDVEAPDAFYKYFCNDLDYIYNVILTKVRNLINSAILNVDEPLTARQIEVFKMATV
jgi:hypothetical protein